MGRLSSLRNLALSRAVCIDQETVGVLDSLRSLPSIDTLSVCCSETILKDNLFPSSLTDLRMSVLQHEGFASISCALLLPRSLTALRLKAALSVHCLPFHFFPPSLTLLHAPDVCGYISPGLIPTSLTKLKFGGLFYDQTCANKYTKLAKLSLFVNDSVACTMPPNVRKFAGLGLYSASKTNVCPTVRTLKLSTSMSLDFETKFPNATSFAFDVTRTPNYHWFLHASSTIAPKVQRLRINLHHVQTKLDFVHCLSLTSLRLENVHLAALSSFHARVPKMLQHLTIGFTGALWHLDQDVVQGLYLISLRPEFRVLTVEKPDSGFSLETYFPNCCFLSKSPNNHPTKTSHMINLHFNH
jgi:hypothetical protein